MTWLPPQGCADGVWLSSGSIIAAELAAATGFAWALIDLEHGAAGEAEALAQIQALTPGGTAPIVRLPAAGSELATRLLDAGAAGLMAPRVEDAATAAAFAAKLRYPPRGHRGVSGSCRAAGYGAAWPDYRAQADTAMCCLVQIETAAGVEAAGQIAAVDGVDVLFIGHSDLAADLGCGDDVCAPAVVAAELRVLEACRRHGKRAGMLLKAGMSAAPRRAAGFAILALGSDVGCLRSGFARLRAT
jgi:2-keto-3-deoxy-L-rhamnonate aldolase RhmA